VMNLAKTPDVGVPNTTGRAHVLSRRELPTWTWAATQTGGAAPS